MLTADIITMLATRDQTLSDLNKRFNSPQAIIQALKELMLANKIKSVQSGKDFIISLTPAEAEKEQQARKGSGAMALTLNPPTDAQTIEAITSDRIKALRLARMEPAGTVSHAVWGAMEVAPKRGRGRPRKVKP